MGKFTNVSLAKRDDPIYSEGFSLTTRREPTPSANATPTSTGGEPLQFPQKQPQPNQPPPPQSDTSDLSVEEEREYGVLRVRNMRKDPNEQRPSVPTSAPVIADAPSQHRIASNRSACFSGRATGFELGMGSDVTHASTSANEDDDLAKPACHLFRQIIRLSI